MVDLLKLKWKKLLCNKYFRKTISGGVMFKKVSYPTLFILIALCFMLSGFSGCGPIINKQPADTTVSVGGVAYFSVGAISLAEPMAYQWEKLGATPGSDWTAISGATYSTLTIPAVSLEDNGAKYRCLVKNIFGQTPTKEAVLTVAKRIYVNSAATGGDNGTSWANAYTDLQDALARSTEGFEIWVAKGTYKPTSDSNRTVSFVMVPGMALYGGFSGTEDGLEERDWGNNVTTLSGDIGTEGLATDNSWHVVIGSDNAVLDGFTVSDGYANTHDAPYSARGGGMLNIESNPMVNNCTFNNDVADYGGGIANFNAQAIINNTLFTNNCAGGGEATGVLNSGGANSIVNCTFRDSCGAEDLSNWGGDQKIEYCKFTGPNSHGIQNMYTNVEFNNCIFNGTDFHYPCIYDWTSSNQKITSCTFLNNGIAIRADSDGSTVITNCAFFDNYTNQVLIKAFGPTTITNCTIVNNSTAIEGSAIVSNCIIWKTIFINPLDTPPVVSHSDIQGSGGSTSWDPGFGTDGGHNIDSDPLFVDIASGNLQLQAGSPCIDAGNNNALPPGIITDLLGNPRISGIAVDMGAYEYQN
jgi:hypothetical protein